MVEPVDIANAILWLVSGDARYVTGVTLASDEARYVTGLEFTVDAGNAIR